MSSVLPYGRRVLRRMSGARLRVLIGLLIMVVGLTVVVDRSQRDHARALSVRTNVPRSGLLSISVLGYTNGQALLQIRNRTRQTIHMDHSLYVVGLDDGCVPDFHLIACYDLSNYTSLPAGGTCSMSIRTPSDGQWKVAIGCVGEREILIKRALVRTWFFRWQDDKWFSMCRFAQTEWVKR